MMKQVRLLFVGIGGYGSTLANSIQKIPFFKIASCYHHEKAKNEKAARLLNCRAALNEEEAFFDEKIDGVIIATPDPSHSHYIEMAINAGLHIFVEKPMVGSLNEALNLENRLCAYNKTFLVGHNMRRFPGFRYIKNEVDMGKLGQLVTFQISLSHGGMLDWDGQYWRTHADLCREGPLRTNGVHASDVLEYLFGEIDAVYSMIDDHFTEHLSPDSGIALVRINKACGTISTHWTVPSINHFRFQFTDAHIEYDLNKMTIRYGRDNHCQPTSNEEIDLPSTDTRKEQLKEFYYAITQDRPIETGFKEGMRAVIFVEACYQSSEKMIPITLSEVRL
jgi:predicted dehydrogenase